MIGLGWRGACGRQERGREYASFHCRPLDQIRVRTLNDPVLKPEFDPAQQAANVFRFRGVRCGSRR